MAYDEGLAQRLREILQDEPGFVEKQMFGGIGLLLDGNMCCGVHKDNLVARVGPDAYEKALERPGAGLFDGFYWGGSPPPVGRRQMGHA